jgi:hypothetical protein
MDCSDAFRDLFSKNRAKNTNTRIHPVVINRIMMLYLYSINLPKGYFSQRLNIYTSMNAIPRATSRAMHDESGSRAC